MIVKMQKVFLAVLRPEFSRSLDLIRDLGVLHVIPVENPASEEIESIKKELNLARMALGILSAKKISEKEAILTPKEEISSNILSLIEKKNELKTRLQFVLNEIKRLEPLGHFQPSDFEYLKKNIVFAKLYKATKNELRKTKIPLTHGIVGKQGHFYFVFVVSDEDFDLPFEGFLLPEKGLLDFLEEKERLYKDLAAIESQLDRYRASIPSLKQEISSLEELLEFQEVVASSGEAGKIRYLKGYIPADDLEKIRKQASKMGWALMAQDPSLEDEVPTLINNPKWIRIIDPVFEFMGTVPGYEEFDVSFWFLISLSLFFAMLVGDGGYGIVFLLGTITMRLMFPKAKREPFLLLYVFSIATILWGSITGTWFGAERFANLAVLNGFIIEELNSYSDNQYFLMELCFILGTIHLTIAHILRGLRVINSVCALAELGWILILWSLYFVAGHLVLGKVLPSFIIFLALLGICLTGLFSNPKKNFLRSSILGFADLPLNIIRSFSDVVSYLRLFAVGYATLVVANSFNQMALDLGRYSFLGYIAAGLVLLLGHVMNIIMSAMAVLVHGIRLNMLEFSSHLGMSWTGKRYQPFKKMTEIKPGQNR